MAIIIVVSSVGKCRGINRCKGEEKEEYRGIFAREDDSWLKSCLKKNFGR